MQYKYKNISFNDEYVVGLTKKIASKYTSYGEYDDIYQIIMMRIFELAMKYDGTSASFETYCYNYIRNDMQEYYNKFTVGMGYNRAVYAKYAKIKEIMELHHTTDVDEIAEISGLSKKTVVNVLGYSKTASLNKKLDDEESEQIELCKSGYRNPEEEYMKRARSVELDELIHNNLNKLEYEIVVSQLGLFGHEQISAADLANKAGVSRQYYQGIYNKALSKLSKLGKASFAKLGFAFMYAA